MAGLDQLLQQILGGGSSVGGMDVAKLTSLLQPLLQQLQSSGGLQGMLGQLQAGGLGDHVGSWLSSGSNEAVDPQKLADALGPQEVESLAEQSGMSPTEVTAGLSQILPGLVDKLSPSGSLPASAEDLTGMLGQIPGGDQLGGILGGLLGGNT
jgi:uncharacterized protein YidB (DUF937 family)